MTISGPRLRTLLRQAERTAEAGKRAAAVQLYEQIIEEDANAVAAWLGLASVAADEAEQKRLYKHVLTLDPNEETAQRELARLRGEVVGEPEPIIVEETAVIEPEHDHKPVEEAYELTCYRHPNRATSLRCYTCGKPICTQCAVKTPVGYRCPDCVRELENTFFEATPRDYLLVPVILFPISLILGYLVVRFAGGGFFLLFFMFAIAGGVGSWVGRIGHRVAGRRRGRYLPHIAAACVALGILIPGLLFFLMGFAPGLLGAGIYLLVAPMAAFYQLR